MTTETPKSAREYTERSGTFTNIQDAERTAEQKAQYDTMIQQYMGDAKSVDGDPGAVHPFTQGTGAMADTEAVSRVVDTAGSAWVWHMQTYKACPVNLNMLPDQLRKKDEFGKPLFTVYGPENDRSPIKGMYPVKGIHKCLLHPDGEHRVYYNTLGLPVCGKSTIKSPYEVTQHMRVKHEQEWKGIEQQREADEKADDRKFQRELLGLAVTGNAPVAPASEMPSTQTTVSDTRYTNAASVLEGEAVVATSEMSSGTAYVTFGDEVTEVPIDFGDIKADAPEAAKHDHKPKKKKRKQQMLACEVCSLELEAGSTLAVRNRLKKHMKEEHADG